MEARRGGWPVISGMLAAIAVPLGVALAVLRSPRWFPLLDMAQTELRVRDVASSHPPLIGLAGRIGTFAQQGSHPGPLSFWALWPFYEIFGANSWALEAAGVALNLLAIGLALWLAYRRGGPALLLGVGTAVALLTRALGAEVLTQPWNPYIPIMWWFAFLLAVWSVACDDLPALPFAVFAGTMCVQTHVSYLGLVLGLVAAMVVYLGVRVYQRRDEREERRRILRWSAWSGGLAIFLWIPPVIDQLVHDPGNLRVIFDYFKAPPESPIGLGSGLKFFLANLSPGRLITGLSSDFSASGSTIPGILMLVASAAAFAVAWRMRHQLLLRLNAVIAVALVLGLISASRIFGVVWFYLLLWGWATSALMLVAVGWTVAAVANRLLDPPTRSRASRAGSAALVAITVSILATFVAEASTVEIPTPRLSRSLAGVVPGTVRALERRHGRGEPYLVTWLPDPSSIGNVGYGMLNELERAGFDVKTEAGNGQQAGATEYRLLERADAKVEVHVAVGSQVAVWRKMPGFTEVAHDDVRTSAQRAAYARIREQLISLLLQAGQDDNVPAVDSNLFVLGLNPHLPKGASALVGRLLNLGDPVAVFIGRPAPASSAIS
jgi:hypothetical protein